DGDAARALVAESGAELLAVVSGSVPTIQKTRFVAKGHHVMRMDREVVVPLGGADEDELFAKVAAKLPETDVVILSDYAKGLLSRSFCERVIAAGRAAGRPVYVDPKGKDYRKYSGATLVKPNRKELEAVCGVEFDPSAPGFLDTVVRYAKRLLEMHSIDNAVVTLSEKGMVYVPRGEGETIYLPTEGREVSDVSGAGDTTMAALAAARAASAPWRAAMEIANAAAGIVVGKVGTAVVSPQELKSALARRGAGAMPFEGKIMDRDALKRRVAAWQAEGLRVGFTNGCFDCLHCGHLSSLFQAKEHCDRLVVAVNSDASVRRLKGPTRPVQDERTRTLVLAGLEIVDAVTVFDEETALPVVEALRPDVVAKEGYTIDRWPEAQFVVSYGGEAVTLKRVDGYSTSAMVDRLNSKGGS
ncbi:MAG: bifunctional heptose 7-phosphate kinase/heptose 1-phosphate adenyltransferase, partial [Kiritimatiellae bacterium]|nr:bifunctional heptose 7-phosphate kinase/heptose 1-phosphate adenyltransferase [Kiritimatiellia bacterium]